MFATMIAGTLAATGLSGQIETSEMQHENVRSRAIVPTEQTEKREVETPVTEWVMVEVAQQAPSIVQEVAEVPNAAPAPAPALAVAVTEDQENLRSAVYAATSKEVECLMSAMFYEARGEPLEGRIAVAEVVLARRDSGRYPRTACGVIAQRSQFSFVRGGHIPPVKNSDETTYRNIVMKVLSGEYKSKAKGSMFFHATYARPSWRHSLTRVSQIGRHLFYKS